MPSILHLAGDRDGIAAATIIRDELDLPVIFLTAHSDQATLDRAKRTSPYGYLVKSFDDQELRATIETAVYRHQSNTQLRRMERWLRTTLHSIGDGVITVDLERKITFINPVAEQITGWTRQAAIGRHVFVLRDNDNHRIEDPIGPVIDDGEMLRFDEHYQIDTKDGNRRRIDDTVAPIRNTTGELDGGIIIFRDATSATSKWELEQQRLKNEKRMQEAQRLESLGVLASGVAHDFNNLLAIMMGHSELIRESPNLSDAERQSIDSIRDAARRATHLCEQLVGYSEDDNFDRSSVDLHGVLEQCVHVLSPRLPDHFKVKFDVSSELGHVHGHFGRLQQLFGNLINNGVEAMVDEPGSLDISASVVDALPAHPRITPAKETPPGQQWLLVAIEDEGVGIPESALERIFDPFFSTKFIGRGLGLSIVFNIVRAHEGALNLRTSAEVDTRFEIFLPLTQKPVAPPNPPSPPQSGVRPKPGTPSSWTTSRPCATCSLDSWNVAIVPLQTARTRSRPSPSSRPARTWRSFSSTLPCPKSPASISAIASDSHIGSCLLCSSAVSRRTRSARSLRPTKTPTSFRSRSPATSSTPCSQPSPLDPKNRSSHQKNYVTK
ncbi:MAG: PAS domain S-box protein [Candidatus Synoicihabitans palmerolidicus]|nr:PAS domain S-box protein [Candidatus Synoicihabitans palmerolidicus]